MIKINRIAKIFFILSLGLFILEGCSTTIRQPPEQNKTCGFFNAEECNFSCQTNADCKFSLGHCVNINEEVYLPEGVMPAYVELTCECKNNECAGNSTGRAAI